jgi:predicted helicase
MNKFQGANFEDIYDFTQNLTKKEKGDLFEEFTYHLFKLDARLNQNLENIWLYKDIPNKILKELSLPTKDKGIDLLAKIDGEYYAIQCKFRQDPTVIIPWASLSTFFGLSFGLNDKIKGGFLVTNTYDLCEEVINSTKVQPIYGDFFDSLPKNFFDCIRKSNTKVKYPAKKPFLHQRECLMNCLIHYRDFPRAHVEMACGSGKTLTAYWIDKKLFNKKTVVFVPSLYLLSQFYADWVNQSYAENRQIKYLLVGSDADVDEETKYKSNGLFLYTDPKAIRKFIKNTDGKLVIISTYQSSDKLAEACGDIEFDFGFFDEAHKTAQQVNKKFSMMITNKHMMIRRRLFMTATPKIYSGDLDNDKIISMDNKKFYGDKIFTYNTGQAIEDKKLVDYQVLSIYAKNKDIEKDIKKNKLVKYKEEFVDEEANYLAIILVLLKKIHDGTCKHMITYHNKVKRAIKFRDFLIKINKLLYEDEIFVDSLDGSTSMGKRTKIIREFVNSAKGVICSARVLNEGINIPIVDSVCFVDPRFSTIDIVQCIGRALRLYPGKELAHIIVPTFINDFDDEFDKNVYGNVIQILKALKTTDNGVIEYFRLRTQGKVNKRTICANEYYNTDIDISKEIDLDGWYEDIDTKIWKIVDNFEYTYEKIKKWIDENNKMPSHRSTDKNERNLGYWSNNKKTAYNKGKLTENKIKKLEMLPFWNWNKKIQSFDESYIELKKWINENNKMPSQCSTDIIEKRLSCWIRTNKMAYKKDKLTEDKIKKLEILPFWYWKNNMRSFDESYIELKKWINENNKMPSDHSTDKIEKRLGRWIQDRKKAYKKDKLTEDKIKKLEILPFWYWKNNIKYFDEPYIELKKWVNENNKMPSDYSTDKIEKRLGYWLQNRKKAYKKGKLTKDQIKKLEILPFWQWNINIKSFDESYTELKKWINENNKMPSYHSTDKIERYLGSWSSRRRVEYKKGKLSKDKIKKLEKLSLWYWNRYDKKKSPKTKQYSGSKTNKPLRKNQ